MITSNIDKFIKETTDKIEKEHQKQQSKAREIILASYSKIVKESAVDTGLYKSSHLISVNSSIPNAPTREDISRIKDQERKIQELRLKHNDSIKISNSLKYATALEAGHSKQQRPALYGRTRELARKLIRKAK